MSLLRFLLALTLLAGISPRLQAQSIADPTSWTYKAVKTAEGDYNLVFHLSLKDGWHIWSLQPGGDGFQIVPSFHVDLKKGIKTSGRLSETGKVSSVNMEGIDGKVNYFSHEVTYTLPVKAGAGTVITGKHEYQVCTEALCLPPVEKTFSIELN